MKPKLLNKLGFTIAILAANQQAHSAVLVDETFTSSDGGFTEIAVAGSPPEAWVFTPDVPGAWSVNGSTDTNEDALVSAEYSMAAPAVLRVTMEHRYNFEPGYDGGVVQYSVDGGAWRNIPQLYFVQNGYPRNMLDSGTSIGLQPAFTGKSPGYDEGTYITTVADFPPQPAGAKIKVRFLGTWDQGTRAAPTPNWELNSVRLETLPDADGDSIPDDYESANGLNASVNDAAADLDGDGSPNLQEYVRRTTANNADTDGDGAADGIETGTGVWASATDTGSNPLVPDTDGDGLRDGLENLSQPSTGLTQPGSDPNKKDTDGDGYPDYSEAAFGSDTKLVGSKPLLNAQPLHLLSWWNFNDASQPGMAFDASHSLPGVLQGGVSYTADLGGRTGAAGDRALDMGSETSSWQATGKTMAVSDASFLNLAAGKNQIAISFWQKLSAVSEAVAFWSNNRLISAHAPWVDSTFYWDVANATSRLSAAKPAGTDLTTAWHHIVMQKNGPVMEVWLDGVRIGTKSDASALSATFSSLFIGSTDTTGYKTAGLIDDFAVYAEALTESQIARLAAGDTPASIVPPAADADGDDMLDVYEDANGLNKNSPADRNTDLDSDGLSNFQESVRGTKANVADTDGDGLLDGVESASGVFVSAANTGTDPLAADSDSDGLADGLETGTGVYVSPTATGSDPNKKDTDGDTLDDFVEVNTLKSNPVDPANPARNKGIGVTFPYSAGTTLAASEVAGYGKVLQNNWNITNPATAVGTIDSVTGPTPGVLVDGTGAATSATISWSATNNYFNNNGGGTPNSKLMNGFLGTFTTLSVTLEQIPYTAYDVYVYMGGDVNGRTGSVTDVASSKQYYYYNSTALSGFGYQNFVQATTTNISSRTIGNYAVFRHQTSPAFQVDLSTDGTGAGQGLHGIQLVPVKDTDNDGMSDEFEEANGLNKANPADAAMDPDNDGLTNLQEYAAFTDPAKADTDNDGYSDGMETNTGEWTDATHTGTDPLNPDMDRDGLKDGQENLSLPAGSSPLLKDTDGDGYSDSAELTAQTNPRDAASSVRRKASAQLINVDFDSIDGGNGRRPNPVTFDGVFTTTATGASVPYEDADSLAADQWNGSGMNDAQPLALVDSTGAPTNVTASWSGFTFGYTNWPNTNGSATVYANGPDTFTNGPNADGFYATAGVRGLVTIRGLDPAKTYNVATLAAGDPVKFTIGSDSRSTGGWDRNTNTANWFVYTDIVPDGGGNIVITAESTGSNFGMGGFQITPAGTVPDQDQDGLPDPYEDAHGLNKNNPADAAQDPDGDSLSTLVEFRQNTDPKKADSDGDGLNDNVETNTGSWTGLTDTGTDPLKADTDGDGLSDGAENFSLPAGTNPLKADTDGDGFPDGAELTAQTDPRDPASNSRFKAASQLINVDFNSVTNTQGRDPDPRTFDGIFTTPATGASVAMEDSDFSNADQWNGIGFNDTPSQPLIDSKGALTNVSVTWSGFNFTYDNWFNTDGASYTNGPNADGFYGGSNVQGVVTISGLDPAKAYDVATLGAGDSTKFTIGTDARSTAGYNAVTNAANWFIYNDVVPDSAGAIVITASTTGANFGMGGFQIAADAMPELPKFNITACAYNPVNHLVSLTWESQATGSYAVYYSADLANWSGPVMDNIPASGAATTSTSFTVPPIVSGSSRVFFRVVLK